ncbi:MAG: hypothetical protein AB1896_10040 [Thermodesulfobacteriota bacterium]
MRRITIIGAFGVVLAVVLVWLVCPGAIQAAEPVVVAPAAGASTEPAAAAAPATGTEAPAAPEAAVATAPAAPVAPSSETRGFTPGRFDRYTPQAYRSQLEDIEAYRVRKWREIWSGPN